MAKNELCLLPIAFLVLFIHFRTALLHERGSQGPDRVSDKVNHGSLQTPGDTIEVPSYEISLLKMQEERNSGNRSLQGPRVRRAAQWNEYFG